MIPALLQGLLRTPSRCCNERDLVLAYHDRSDGGLFA